MFKAWLSYQDKEALSYQNHVSQWARDRYLNAI